MEAFSNPYTVLAEAERNQKPVSVRMYINEVTFQVTHVSKKRRVVEVLLFTKHIFTEQLFGLDSRSSTK